MKNKITKTILFSLVAAALIAAPAVSRAEDSTNMPAATAPAPKKAQGYHGKVVAVDATAMTFTVGKTTIAVASTTKITKDGAPAVFADIAVGANVTGSYKKDADGKATATSIKLGQAKNKDVAPKAKQDASASPQ
jgi:hypothetical protein